MFGSRADEHQKTRLVFHVPQTIRAKNRAAVVRHAGDFVIEIRKARFACDQRFPSDDVRRFIITDINNRIAVGNINVRRIVCDGRGGDYYCMLSGSECDGVKVRTPACVETVDARPAPVPVGE